MHKPNGKKSSKTALLRIYLIIDSAKREKRKENRGEEKARSYWQVLCPRAAASNPISSLVRTEHPSCPQPMCSLRCQSQMLSLFLHFKGRAQHKAEHATCSLSPTLIFLSFFFASLPQKHRPRHCQPQRSFAGQREAEGLLVLWLGVLPVFIYSPVQNFASS